MTSGLTDRRYHWLSYGGMVRALGLEPSLLRGKSPVPDQSGVTRVRGPGGNRTPCVVDGWVTASCAPWRVRPVGDQVVLAPHDDAYAVVKVRLSGLAVRLVRAGSEGVEPPAVGVGDRGATNGSSPWDPAHDGVRGQQLENSAGRERRSLSYRRAPGLPWSASGRSGLRPSLSGDWPGRHADAPRLPRAVPRNHCSVVSMRAIGRFMVRIRAAKSIEFRGHPGPPDVQPGPPAPASRRWRRSALRGA